MKGLLRAPLLHFLLIGAAVLAVLSWRESGHAAPETIVVPAARRAELRGEWERTHGAPPTAAEEAWLVEREIEEEVLFREALRHGLDAGNTFVRYRLVTLMRFLGENDDAGEEDLVREARALGLHRSDLVIRRHLVETVRLLGARTPAKEPLGDEELRRFLERDPERYRRPPRVSFTHVFFSADRRGDRARADATVHLERLRAAAAGPDEGDPFIHGARMPLLSEAELARRFGDGFARKALAVPDGGWHGPVRSPYGFHLLRIEERDEGGVPDFEALRPQLARGLAVARAEDRLRRRIAEWRSRYRIVVEEAVS